MNGDKILSDYLKYKGFYIGIVELIFSNSDDKILIKLCCSIFNNFVKKFWCFENYIDQEEKFVITLINLIID